MTEIVLDTRSQEILRNIISGYILTGEPIGSRTIAKMTREGLSPASVRNVMADLEELGLLAQPHTSAGRVPTERGYRYYIDWLLKVGQPAARDRALIESSLSRVGGEFTEAMEAIPKLLARLTRHVGYLLTPPRVDAVLKQIEFMRLHARRVLVVFVDRDEVVTHRILDMEEDLDQEALSRAARYLVDAFAGRTLQEIRDGLVRLMAEEKARFDSLLANAITLGTRYLDAESQERRVVLDGTTNIMQYPEFSDVDTMKRLFETFEEKHRLVTLLDRCLDPSGPRVVLGSEIDDPALGSMALVASPYRLVDGAAGWIGILGPTRMEYERAMSLVGYISRLFSTLLTRHNP